VNIICIFSIFICGFIFLFRDDNFFRPEGVKITYERKKVNKDADGPKDD
jgi:hypothetical protein